MSGFLSQHIDILGFATVTQLHVRASAQRKKQPSTRGPKAALRGFLDLPDAFKGLAER
jgi:hypothetical protein